MANVHEAHDLLSFLNATLSEHVWASIHSFNNCHFTFIIYQFWVAFVLSLCQNCGWTSGFKPLYISYNYKNKAKIEKYQNLTTNHNWAQVQLSLTKCVHQERKGETHGQSAGSCWGAGIVGSCPRSRQAGPAERCPCRLCTETKMSRRVRPSALATTRKPEKERCDKTIEKKVKETNRKLS